MTACRVRILMWQSDTSDGQCRDFSRDKDSNNNNNNNNNNNIETDNVNNNHNNYKITVRN